jgi:hypothetical protein
MQVGWGTRSAATRNSEGRGKMKTRITMLLMAAMMLVMSVAPAFADSGRPRRPQPEIPPGLSQSGVDRPDQAPIADVGRQNAEIHRQNF